MLMVMRWNSLERSAVEVVGVTLIIVGGVAEEELLSGGRPVELLSREMPVFNVVIDWSGEEIREEKYMF